VIDVANPSSPRIVGSAATPGGAGGVAVSGDHVYVSGLDVIDVSDPTNPRLVGRVAAPGSGVAVSGTHAYVPHADYGLQVIDVSNPASPGILGSAETPGEAYGVAVSGNLAYLGDSQCGLQVIDITYPAGPQIIGSVETPGWAYGVAVSGTHAYVADRSSLQVIDVTNPSSPRSWAGGDVGAQGAAVSSATTPRRWLLGGFRVINLARKPRMVGGVHIGLGPWRGRSEMLVSSWCRSPVVDITAESSDRGRVYTGRRGVSVSGTRAYVATGQSGLRVIDVRIRNLNREASNAGVGPSRDGVGSTPRRGRLDGLR
jgi:hypothetical protein